MQKIQAVIFDVDGVLFDSMWMWDELDEKYLRSLGLEMREETTKAVSKMSFEEAACGGDRRADPGYGEKFLLSGSHIERGSAQNAGKPCQEGDSGGDRLGE